MSYLYILEKCAISLHQIVFQILHAAGETRACAREKERIKENATNSKEKSRGLARSINALFFQMADAQLPSLE